MSGPLLPPPGERSQRRKGKIEYKGEREWKGRKEGVVVVAGWGGYPWLGGITPELLLDCFVVALVVVSPAEISGVCDANSN